MTKKAQKIFAGNWKMYKSVEEANAFVEKFISLLEKNKVDQASEYILLAQSPLLLSLKTAISRVSPGIKLSIGAQNIHWESEGAFTGELSPRLAHDLGCKFILAGHSERRQFFGETNESAVKRALAANRYQMRPIFCVGENLAEREAGKIFEVLRAQCEPLFNLSPQMPPGFIVAYEPVWAIGTGKTASSAQAEEVHAFLRQLFGQIWGGENARKLPLLYGGSVKPQNSAELLACSNIDGVLVGGASLDPLSFFEIAANAIQC